MYSLLYLSFLIILLGCVKIDELQQQSLIICVVLRKNFVSSAGMTTLATQNCDITFFPVSFILTTNRDSKQILIKQLVCVSAVRSTPPTTALTELLSLVPVWFILTFDWTKNVFLINSRYTTCVISCFGQYQDCCADRTAPSCLIGR